MTPNDNGLTAGNSQPVKTLTERTVDFNALTQRQQVCLSALRIRPIPREELDRTTGASNAPQIVFELRKMGFEIPCERVNRIDRYGQPCKPGIYSLSAADRELMKGSL